MGKKRYSMKDLEQGSKYALDALEERAQKNGRKLAEEFIHGSRGLWLLLHVPGWFVIFFMSIGIFSAILINFGLSEFLAFLAGIPVGYVLANKWFKSKYTIYNPFKSFVIFTWIIPFLVIFVLMALGFNM